MEKVSHDFESPNNNCILSTNQLQLITNQHFWSTIYNTLIHLWLTALIVWKRASMQTAHACFGPLQFRSAPGRPVTWDSQWPNAPLDLVIYKQGRFEQICSMYTYWKKAMKIYIVHCTSFTYMYKCTYLLTMLNASSVPIVQSERMAAYVGAKWGSWPAPPREKKRKETLRMVVRSFNELWTNINKANYIPWSRANKGREGVELCIPMYKHCVQSNMTCTWSKIVKLTVIWQYTTTVMWRVHSRDPLTQVLQLLSPHKNHLGKDSHCHSLSLSCTC